jgi:hypothetical protein
VNILYKKLAIKISNVVLYTVDFKSIKKQNWRGGYVGGGGYTVIGIFSYNNLVVKYVLQDEVSSVYGYWLAVVVAFSQKWF